jgi:glyoxylase-like metal-dependent hydrolase (beta-lactamase superfamily II)
LNITVFHTPGHTPGSVCYLVNGLLISGDTLLKGTIGKVRGKSPEERQANIKKLAAVIKKKLTALPENTPVFPGHGHSTVIKDEKESNPYLK